MTLKKKVKAYIEEEMKFNFHKDDCWFCAVHAVMILEEDDEEVLDELALDVWEHVNYSERLPM